MNALLRAVSTPRRQELLRLCWDREQSAGELHRAMPDVTFGAVSQHLRLLTEASLLTVRRDGRRRLYRADQRTAEPLRPMLEEMWDDALWQLKLRAELEAGRRGPRSTARRTSSRPRSPKRR